MQSYCRSWVENLTAASEPNSLPQVRVEPFTIGFSILSPIQTPVSATFGPPRRGWEVHPQRHAPVRQEAEEFRQRDGWIGSLSAALGMCRLEATRHRGYMGMEHDGKWRCFTIENCDLAWNHQTLCNMICLKQEIQWCGFDWLYIIICENLSSPNQDLRWFTKQNMDLTVCMHIYIMVSLYIYSIHMWKQLITNFTRSGFKHDWYAWRNMGCLTNNNDQVCGFFSLSWW